MKRVLDQLMMHVWFPLALLLASGMAVGADNHAALILVSTGKVEAIDAAGQVRALGRRAPVFVGDTVVTGENSVAQIKFTDGSLVAMKADSQLRIERYSTREGDGADAFGVSVLKGGFRSLTGAIGKRSPGEYKVGARVATIGIRGTDYEVDLDLDNGLGLGVWSGAIEACNEAGCLELGAGEPFRFAFVPIRGGAPEGRLHAPAGVGGGTLPGGQAAGGSAGQPGNGGPSSLPGAGDGEESLMEDAPGTSIGEVLNSILGPDAPLDLRAKYPYVGLGMARTPISPLGDAYVAEFSAIDFAAATQPNGFRFMNAAQTTTWSADASTLYAAGSPYEGPTWDIVGWSVGHADDTPVFGIYAMAESTSFNGEPMLAESLAVAGQYVAPSVVSSQQGFMTMALSPNPHASAIWGSSVFHMVDGVSTPGDIDTLDASLKLDVDFYSATATGDLSFSDTTGRWKLRMSGGITGSGLALAVTSGTGGSVFRPWQESVDYGVSGNLETRFVGSATVDGLLGAFRVVTDPVATWGGPLQASGVFVAEPYQLPARADFPLHALAVSTTAGTALGDVYRAGFGVLDSYTNVVNPTVEDIYDFGFTTDGVNYLTQSSDPAASGEVLAEGWRVENQTLVGFVTSSGPLGFNHGDLVWGAPVGETAFAVFGDYTHPEVVASLTGTTYFSLGVDSIDQPALRYAQDGVVAKPSSASLSMSVDFTQLTASGYLSISDSANNWNLEMNGTVAGNGLALSIVPGVDGGSTGSVYQALGQTGAPMQGVTGTASAIFAGASTVDALLGAFRAETVAGALPAHSIHGAFIGTPYLPQ